MANAKEPIWKPVTHWIGSGGGWLLRHVVSALTATRITPNMLTLVGMVVNVWAAVLFAYGEFRGAAAVLFLAGFLDMADGQVARRAGRVTAFGAFLDSTLDRYSDLGLYMGLVVYYTLIGRPFYMGLAAVAMASSFMVSYARARAESLIPLCKVGFFGTAGAARIADPGRCLSAHGAGVMGDCHALDADGNPSRGLHVAGDSRRTLDPRQPRIVLAIFSSGLMREMFIDWRGDNCVDAIP